MCRFDLCLQNEDDYIKRCQDHGKKERKIHARQLTDY
jgi:hypothetical protein